MPSMDIWADIPQELQRRLERLEELLHSYGSAALGYSGGVDSTFLAAVCARCISERTLLVHLNTPFVGTPERGAFERGADELGLKVAVVELDPLADPAVAANSADRCYRCKRAGFMRIYEVARRRGISTVLEGSNADDADDYRPGMRAIRELGVRSPLMETGWHKEDERTVLRAWGVPVWNLPAGACLATRIPCGERLTARKLGIVRSCEDYLHALGLRQVRVRLVDGRAQVSAAPDDLERLRTLAKTDVPAAACGGSVPLSLAIINALRSRGAHEVDPIARVYKKGAMNAR